MPAESDTVPELGPAVRALAAGQVVFGRYELRRKLGEGGFGAVWLVHDSALREEVALKFVLQAVASSPEAIDALKEEAGRSRRLTHPNIVRIHDFISDAVGGAYPDLAGISMEYVDGESLAQRRLREPGKCFDVDQIAPWIDQVCQALTYAHAPKRRVIHRDLKPPNLLVTVDGEVKVADFGISCSLINSVTQISGRLSSGTPPFISPQQLSGEWPSESDDIYSLGATLYMLLTGTPPFHQGDIVHQVMNKVASPMHERRERLGLTGRAPIPQPWEETVAACLAKDAAARPASVEAVAQRLGLRASTGATAPVAHPEDLATERIDQAATVQTAREPIRIAEPPPSAKAARPAIPAARVEKPVASGRRPWIRYAALLLLALVLIAGGYLVKRYAFPDQSADAGQTSTEVTPLESFRLPFPISPVLRETAPGVFGDLSGEHWGYTDGLGHEVIPPQWHAASTFCAGRALVRSGEKYGFIDPAGSVVIPAEWESASSFSEGRALVRRDHKFGYLDADGKLVILPQWEAAESFSESMAWVTVDGKSGAIDTEGRLVISAEWQAVSPFSEGLAVIESEGKFGYVNPDGKLAIAAQWEKARPFSGSLAAVQTEGKWGYINPQGKVVLPPQWESAGNFSEGMAAVQSEGKCGYIDQEGHVIIAPQWEKADPFSQGQAWVSNKGKWGRIDYEGKLVIPIEWDFVGGLEAFSDSKGYYQLARVKKGARKSAAGTFPAEVRWIDSAGHVIWQSP